MRKESVFLSVLLLLLLGAGANANLVLNADFEAAPDFRDWFHSANTIEVHDDNGPTLPGTDCVQIPDANNLRSKAIAVVEGQTYDFQFDYLGGVIRSRVRYYENVNPDNGAAAKPFHGEKTDFTVTTAAWGRQTVQVTIPTGLNVNYVDIVFNATTVDGGKIDNVYFAPEYNLISNGDAEADFQGWSHTPAPFTVICTTDSASTGTKSFELNNTSDPNQVAALRSDAIAFDPNEPLMFRFSYKTLPGFNLINDNGLRVLVRYFDSGSTFVTQDNIQLPVTEPNSWTDEEYVIQAPEDPTIAQLDLRFGIHIPDGNAIGVARFDDIELYYLDCPWVPDQELLANGGFETGDFTNWQTTPRENISISDTVSYEGTYSLRCDPNSEPNAVSKIVHQPMAVVEDEPVFLSLRYMTDASATAIPISFAAVRFFDSNSVLVDQASASMVLTSGQWQSLTIDEVMVPAGAVNADVYIRTDCDANLYVDAVSLKNAVRQCPQSYGLDDLAGFVSQWLDNDFLPPLSDNGLEDFEGYADQTAMENSWSTSSSYPERGDSTLTLITDPAQTHGGSRAIRWEYDNTVNTQGDETRVWSEFHTTLPSPIDLSQYDEMHVWLNRHPGNSAEELLYVKFYNDSVNDPNILAESQVTFAEGSTSSPTGWNKWVIDLNTMIWLNGAASLDDLDNVVGYFFGSVGDTATQGRGSGTIDFDDIVLVDAIPPCGIAPTWDLSGDCQVNLDDFALFAQDWVGD